MTDIVALSLNANPVELALDRARDHLSAGRFERAASAFQAIIRRSPSACDAHIGLANTRLAWGRRDEAIDGLMHAAEVFHHHAEYVAAIDLYSRAFVLDPTRLELHVRMAAVERSMGRIDAARARIEGLANQYMDAGRTTEAAKLLRDCASWGDPKRSRGRTRTSVREPGRDAPLCGQIIVTHDPPSVPSAPGHESPEPSRVKVRVKPPVFAAPAPSRAPRDHRRTSQPFPRA